MLGINRSSLYCTSRGESEYNRLLMNALDEQYTKTPFYGVLKMTKYLRTLGYEINEKRVRRLLRKRGLEAIYPKPNLSRAHPEHNIYPYLLRGLNHRKERSGMEHGYHLYPLKSGVLLPSGAYRWVQPVCIELGVEHDLGSGLLY